MFISHLCASSTISGSKRCWLGPSGIAARGFLQWCKMRGFHAWRLERMMAWVLLAFRLEAFAIVAWRLWAMVLGT